MDDCIAALNDLKHGRMVSIDYPSLRKKYEDAIALAESKISLQPIIFNSIINQQDTVQASVTNNKNVNTFFTMPPTTQPTSLICDEDLDIRKLAKRAEFEETLHQLVTHLKQNNLINKKITCFISYAWGNPLHEQWVERFAKDLELADIQVLLDRWYDRKGKDLMDFVSEIINENTDFVLVIGTKAYRQKYDRRIKDKEHREPVVGIEARLLDYAIGYSRKRSNQIIPVVLEGPEEQSLPPLLHPKLNSNFYLNDYFDEMLMLLRDIYQIDNRDENFKKIKNKFNQAARLIDQETSDDLAHQYKQAIQEKLSNEEKITRQRVKTHLEQLAEVIEANVHKPPSP